MPATRGKAGAFVPTWTGAQTRRLKALHGQGLSCNKIAHELGVVPSVISRQAKRLGLSFDRTRTAAANEARRVDAAARRLQLELSLLEDADHIRRRIRSPMLYFEWGGKDHDYAEKRVSEPTPADQLKLMQAVGVAVDRSIKIAEHETGSGVERAKSMLTAVAEAFGVKTYEPGSDD